MKTKVIFSVASLIFLSTIYHLFVSVAGPEITTSLALEQFENPSIATDTAIRAHNNANVFWYMCAGWVTFNLLLFRTQIKETIYGS